MSDELQTVIAALVVLGSLIYLAARATRAIQAARLRKTGCGPQCGCE